MILESKLKLATAVRIARCLHRGWPALNARITRRASERGWSIHIPETHVARAILAGRYKPGVSRAHQ